MMFNVTQFTAAVGTVRRLAAHGLGTADVGDIMYYNLIFRMEFSVHQIAA